MNDSKATKLIQNTLFFLIGGFGSKMIQFLLLPLYTHFLSDMEYGTIDLIQTIGTLLLPIFSLSITESVFRFGMDKKHSSSGVLYQGLIIITISTFTFFGISSLFFLTGHGSINLILLGLLIISNAYRAILSQFTRSQEKIQLYVFDNIIQTFNICIINIIAIVYLDLKIVGYFSGYIIANIFSIVLLCSKNQLYKNIKKEKFNRVLATILLRYSLPLIPNSICWWISNSLNRIMVSIILGVGQNGILAVTYKIPNIIALLFDFFIQAWQISANESADQNASNKFANTVFSVISIFVFIFSFFVVVLSYCIFPYIIGPQFLIARNYIPLLSLSIVFFLFAQYLGTFFSAYKRTDLALYTNILSAFVNIIFNLILIPWIGLYGAACSTLISYVILWIIREKETKQFVELKHSRKFFLSLCFFIIQMLAITIDFEYYIGFSIILEALIVYINRMTIRKGLEFIWKKK